MPHGPPPPCVPRARSALCLRAPRLPTTVSWSACSGARFLDRRLLLEVRDHLLVPGGVFLWSTFLEGEENLAPPYRPSRRLLPGELRETFSEAGYEILHDAEGALVTRGTPVPAAFFAARRPGGGGGGAAGAMV